MRPFKRRIGDSATGPATYISATASVKGNLSGDGAYIICGTVEGDCDIGGLVTLAKEGRWIGTLKAASIVIAGTVEGDVVAHERVEVSPTAKITGSITGQSIAVAEGAIIEGELNVTSGAPAIRFQDRRQSPDN